MEAFLSTLLLTALTQIGDRTQVLVAALSIRFHNRTALITACALATGLNCALAAYAGQLVSNLINDDARILFYALALGFASIGMLAWRRPIDILENWRTGAFLTAFAGLFIVQLGDKGQFIIGATAARDGMAEFAMVGGWCGVMTALLPAIIWQEEMARKLPVKTIRKIGGYAFLIGGIYFALKAWRLV